MTPYADLSGKSGVIAFATTPSAIIIEFIDGARYEYNDIKPGAAMVARMKTLAASGRGLSTFISQHVKSNYFRRR